MNAVNEAATSPHEDVIGRAQERVGQLVAAGAPLHETLDASLYAFGNDGPAPCRRCRPSSELTRLITHTAAMAIEHDRSSRTSSPA